MAANRNSSGKYRLSGTDKSYASRNRIRKQKQKKATWNFPLIGLVVLVFAVMLTMIVWGARKIVTTFKANNSIVVNGKFNREVTIDGISIKGLTIDEAKSAIKNKYPWSMSAKFEGAEDNTYQIPNFSDASIDKLTSEVFEIKTEPLKEYNITFNVDENEVKKLAEEMAQKWNVEPRNGSISGFDKETKTFIYSGEQTGKQINQDKIVSDIKSAVSSKNFTAQIDVSATEQTPEITEAQVKEMYKVIGTFTTKTTDNPDRNTNIRLAAESMDGMIIYPGEEFSFNKTTGNRTTDKGYRPAGAYLNGVLIEEPGGGVCQVSSTLYNAVVRAGLNTTERHPHSYEPKYCNPGEDAMVSYDGKMGPDMRFKNDSNVAIAIRGTFDSANNTIKMSIIGIPILPEGTTLTMRSVKTGESDPPKPNYVDDPQIPVGKEVLVDKATMGSTWNTSLIKVVNGVEEVVEKNFHNSIYSGHPATIKKNPNSKPIETSSAVTQTSTSASSESSSSAVTGSTSSTEATTIKETTTQSASQATTKHSEEVKQSTAESTTKGPANSTTAVSATTEEASKGPTVAPTSAPAGSTTEETIPPNPAGEGPIGPGVSN